MSGLPVTPWFGALGEPLSPALREAAQAALRAHGPELGAEVEALADWRDVVTILRREEREGSWWDFEEEERERAWVAACERHTEDEIVAGVEAAVAAEREAISEAIAVAAARLAIGDSGVIDAGRSAALMAVHHDALARLAGLPGDHIFALKRRVFGEGHWPIGVYDGRYVVF